MYDKNISAYQLLISCNMYDKNISAYQRLISCNIYDKTKQQVGLATFN